MKETLMYKLITNAELASFSIAYNDCSLTFQPVKNDTGYWNCLVSRWSYFDELSIDQVPWKELFSQFVRVEVNRVKDYSRWMNHVDVVIYDLDMTIRFFDDHLMFSALPISTMKFLDNLVSYLKNDMFNVEKNRLDIYSNELMYTLCIDLPAKQWKVGDAGNIEAIAFEQVFNGATVEKPLVKNLYEGDKLVSVSVEFPSFILFFNADHTIEFNFK